MDTGRDTGSSVVLDQGLVPYSARVPDIGTLISATEKVATDSRSFITTSLETFYFHCILSLHCFGKSLNGLQIRFTVHFFPRH